jgi:RNA polymerase sigma-70 factor (ECF subfamily)
MRTQLLPENIRTTSVTLSADGLAASRQATAASKREAVVDAIPEKTVERQLRNDLLVHLDDLYAYARFLLPKPADAEDAVHECYLRAILNIGDYRAENARVWLITLLRLVCVREILQRGDCIPGDIDDPKSSVTQACENDKAAVEPPKLVSGQTDTKVRTLVASLPLPLREAIVLHECINLSYSEIAAVTATSASVVNKRLSRARTILVDRGALS